MKSQTNPALEWSIKNSSLLRLMPVDPMSCRKFEEVQRGNVRIHILIDEECGGFLATYMNSSNYDVCYHADSYGEICDYLDETFGIIHSDYENLALSA